MRIDQIHPARWHPARADRIHSGADAASGPPGPLSLGVIARWLLLGAVIAGTFLLHVLTAENDHSIHGAFLSPTITVSQSATPQEALTSAPGDDALAAMVPALAAFVIPSGDRDSGDLSGCILFLVVTAAASVVLLLMQIGKVDVRPPRPTGDAGAITLRGPPPPAMPRLSLGVIRI